MTRRIQILTSVYPEFLHAFLAAQPDRDEANYSELLNRLLVSGYQVTNFPPQYLRDLGYEVDLGILGSRELQAAWMREHGGNGEATDPNGSFARDLVRTFRPDVLVLVDLYRCDRAVRAQLREVSGPQTLFLGWRTAPTSDFAELNDLDVVLSAAPHFVERLRAQGTPVEYVPLAFEHTLLERIPPDTPRDLDFTFSGTIGSGPVSVNSRRDMAIVELLRTTPLQVWARQSDFRPRTRVHSAAYWSIHRGNRLLARAGVPAERRARMPVLSRGVYWTADPTAPPLRRQFPGRVHEPVLGLDYIHLLARSRIAFNIHSDAAETYAGNMRLFEATGMGACLLTDAQTNLPNLFEPDNEVVTYQSIDECVEKVRYLLDHPAERGAIAAAGQRRTLRDHTYQHRVEQLHEIVLRYHSRLPVP